MGMLARTMPHGPESWPPLIYTFSLPCVVTSGKVVTSEKVFLETGEFPGKLIVL